MAMHAILQHSILFELHSSLQYPSLDFLFFFDSVQFALLSFSVYTQQCTCCAAFVALLCSLTTCALGGNPKDAHFHSTYTECVQDATCIQSIDYVELKLLQFFGISVSFMCTGRCGGCRLFPALAQRLLLPNVCMYANQRLLRFKFHVVGSLLRMIQRFFIPK